MTDDLSHSETKFDIGEDLYVTRIEAELETKKRELSAANLLFSPKK